MRKELIMQWFNTIFFTIITIFQVAANAADKPLVEIVTADRNGNQVTLSNAPCTTALPPEVATHIPEGTLLYRAYAENVGESRVHEGCWSKASDAELEAAKKDIQEGGTIVPLVAVYTDDGRIFNVPLSIFKQKDSKKFRAKDTI
jgi:hypothetical protein